MNAHHQRSYRAFVLIELMIVISIIAIIAAIAIPNLLHARKGANESAAISTLRTLVSTQALFHDVDKDGDGVDDYAESLAELGEAGLIDDVLVTGGKSGYCFILVSYSPDSWHAHANPDRPGVSGDRYFYVDETGIVRFADDELATAESEGLDGEEPVDVAEEEPEEHGLTGCGASQGPMAQSLMMGFLKLTTDQLGRQLPAGVSVEDALALADIAELQLSLNQHLDANQDQKLDMEELMTADLLKVAREIRLDVFPKVKGPRIGSDRRVRQWTEWYQARMVDLLDLNINERPSPPVVLPPGGGGK